MFFSSISSQAGNNETLRNLFHKVESEEDLDKILEYQSQIKGPIADAYFGAVTVMKAQYPFFPTKKFKYFSEGTKLIEKSITEKQVVENTYLRMLIQVNTPRFLGYYENIQDDLIFIEKNIDTCPLSIKWRITLLERVLLFENHDYDYQKLKDKLAKFKTL